MLRMVLFFQQLRSGDKGANDVDVVEDDVEVVEDDGENVEDDEKVLF